MKSRLTIAGALCALPVVVSASVAFATGSATPTVHLRGTAYEFNNVHTLLGGAAIRVAEFPKLHATVRPDGTYDLTVPDRAEITPYIVDAGYHTIYLQTFTTDGEDLLNVNFQTPTEGIYRGLVALLGVPVDSNGNPVACAIVSTFNTRDVRDLTFAQFIAYGAHGVAGATASGSPSLPKPVYFNKSVIPDPTQTASSADGGVVWTDVPAGVYNITAHAPRTRFASFVATCKPGRVVNANPPWGLHQLAPRNPAHVSATWAVHGSRIAVRSLSAGSLPKHAIVDVACAGGGCPFETRTLRPTASELNIRRALGGSGLAFHAGETFDVSISAHAFNGVVVRWAFVKGHRPERTTLCVPLGNEKPQHKCLTG